MTTRTPSTAGFTLIESVIAAGIVGVMLASAVSLAGSAGVAQYKTAEKATAGALADAMISEVSVRAYIDPGANPAFGLEPGEGAAAARSAYDDVDDYHGLNEAIPAQRDGTVIPGLTGWVRSVAVAWVSPAAPDSVSGSDTGLKRITVTIRHNNATIVTRATLRSNAP